MISIIIPVYNVEKYIEKCLQSILSQTYSDFEVLLINDGSTDSSCQICQKWAKKDVRFKVITKENGGPSSARNLGLDLANGDYIFFVDSDDQIVPTCLETMMKHMTDDIDLVASNFHDINSAGEILSQTDDRDFPAGLRSGEDAVCDIFLVRLYAYVVWAKLYRKSLWDNLRFSTDLSYSEDTLAIFHIFEKTRRLFLVDEYLYLYLQRTTSISHQSDLKYYKNASYTRFYLHKQAVEKYPMCIEASREHYFQFTIVLLKRYVKEKQKANALKLIAEMKYVYQTSPIPKSSKQWLLQLLFLPKSLYYYLIRLRVLFENVPEAVLNSTYELESETPSDV